VDTAQERGRLARRLVAEGDQAIPPDAERVFAQRMQATTTLVPTNHVATVSHPAEVVTTIETAAAAVPNLNLISLTAVHAGRAAIGQQTHETASLNHGHHFGSGPEGRVNGAIPCRSSFTSRASNWPVTPEVAGSSPVAPVF
jgi:hypothetical protein